MNERGDGEVRAEGRSEDERDLRQLFRLSLDLMCVAGFDGFFKRVSPAFERTLGHSEEALLGSQFIEFVHPDDHERTLAEVEHLAQGSVTVDFENRYRTADGDYRWLAWRAAPVVERGLIFAVARDITENKEAQELLARQAEELERSNADLESFAHVASHDLRAPLRSIVALIGFIETDLGESIPDKTREHLDELRRRALQMKALTDDLLVFSHAGGGDEIESVDTAELVEEVAFLLAPRDGFRVTTTGAMPTLETARGPLGQVLRNLIGNALQHHDRERGEITVSARELDEAWEFAVGDDGPGIEHDDRTRIFGVFEQVGEGSEETGSGMGLSIVQRIVQRFGGMISIDPGDGRGAVFRFTWPKTIAEPTASGSGDAAPETTDADHPDR